MSDERESSGRRRFLQALGAGTVLTLAGCKVLEGSGERGRTVPDREGEMEISPGEDLMREHGVLRRILLIYDESVTRLLGTEPAPCDVIASSADLLRRFIEDYHERLEERFLFPRFESAGRETGLVHTLRTQHTRGRELTKRVLQRVAAGGPGTPSERAALADDLRSFARMYRPHAAREDTVLFPAAAELLGESEYHELGEQFEEREHALFGEHGFADVVAEVADLERRLDIRDLDRFTVS
jgi:hemerythrin-like domain-containing protein